MLWKRGSVLTANRLASICYKLGTAMAKSKGQRSRATATSAQDPGPTTAAARKRGRGAAPPDTTPSIQPGVANTSPDRLKDERQAPPPVTAPTATGQAATAAAKRSRKAPRQEAAAAAAAAGTGAAGEHGSPSAADKPTAASRATKPKQTKGSSKAAQASSDPSPSSKAAVEAASAQLTGVSYYLMKSEPDEFSIEDLQAKPEQTGCWDGVRNPQARNFMKGMKLGDQVLFYYSSCKVPGIVGVVEVAKLAYPDHTAWDSASKYHDPSSSQDNPKWWMVDIKYVRKLRRFISLEELKRQKEGALADMLLLSRPRLSVQPVTQQQWEFVMDLEKQEAPASQ